MGFLEQQLYDKYEEKYGSEEREHFMNAFKRFLDDCFVFWQRSTTELQDFFALLNSLHTKIQFTMETNLDNLSFLDILICKDNRKVYTDIYYKETDTHQYLDFFSCHPKHVKHNIPYTLARRICTIVEKEDIREKRLVELSTFLQKQNYPEGIITKGIEKAKKLTITELRSTKQSTRNNKVLPLVITHNPNNPNVVGMVKDKLKFLSNSTKMKNLLDETKLIVSRRQSPNLKQLLTRAEFCTDKPKPKVSRCDEPRCGTCNLIITGESLQLSVRKNWEIKSTMSCKSKDVIYIIICGRCESSYVGQTQNLRNRVTLHKEQIKHAHYRHLPVSKHLAECNKGVFKIMPIYQCKGQSTRIEREYMEKRIISLLKPELNSDTHFN